MSNQAKKTAARAIISQQIAVQKCFILMDFNEEYPLYILDVGQELLVVFGQWIFDPHTLITSTATFKAWHCDQAFFAQFALTYNQDTGQVFKLTTENASFIQAQRFSHPLRFKRLSECQFIKKQSSDLKRNLQDAGLLLPADINSRYTK